MKKPDNSTKIQHTVYSGHYQPRLSAAQARLEAEQ